MQQTGLSQQSTLSRELEIHSPELASLITYPRYSEGEYSARIKEMQALGVQSIFLGGGKSIVNGASIAGKGCVGLVFKARLGDSLVALKVRRTDADRDSMEREATLHRIANGVGVGPEYAGHTDNLVAMELVEGQSIGDWIRLAGSKLEFRRIARSVLDQCYSLDSAGLDHGELNRIARHVIISQSGQPFIIDFESSSTARRVANVTAAAQSTMLYGGVAKNSGVLLTAKDKEAALASLRKYKKERNDENYHAILESLGIAF